MKKYGARIRIILGMLLAPWIYIVVWTLPVLEHSAFQKWAVINTFFAYVAFLVLAGLSHVALKKINATELWSYCAVMFVVAMTLDLVLSVWLLNGYTSSFYSQPQVVQNGSITEAGVKEALTHGIVSAGAMTMFWFVAIYNPRSKEAHA